MTQENKISNSIKRIFDELTGEEIYDPDLHAGIVNDKQNKVIAKYIVEQEEISEIVPDKVLPNGSRIMKKVITQKEIGDWHLYDYRDGTEREITEDIGIHVPESQAHEVPLTYIETIGIYHTYTPEEIEKQRQDKEQQEEARKQYLARELFITALMNNEQLGALVTQDQSSTTLYEALTRDTNVRFDDTSSFSNAYARRIKREEISMTNVPQELREEVQKILDDDVSCKFVFHIDNGTVTDGVYIDVVEIDRIINRLQTVTLMLVAKNGYRVPTLEEYENNFTITATDDKNKEIDNYKNLFCTYVPTSSVTSAILKISITEKTKTITSNFACILQLLKKK